MSTTQVMQALARANEVRSARADWRRAVSAQSSRDGRQILARGLRTGLSEAVETYRLEDYLRSARRLGNVSVVRLCAAAGVRAGGRWKRVSELSRGERRRLADELERLADHKDVR